MNKLFYLLSNLLLVHASFAYNAKECMTLFPYKDSNYKHILATTTAPTSMTQSITSTGRCAMFGSSNQNKAELFYALNNDKIIYEISAGKGEYLNALGDLFGCDSSHRLIMIQESHLNFDAFINLENSAQFLFLEKSAKKYCQATQS